MSEDWTPPPAAYYPPMPPAPPSRRRGVLVGVGLAGAGLAAGAIIGGTVLSSAATSSSTPVAASSTSSSSTGTSEAPDNDGGRADRHDGGHAGEGSVPASLTATLKAAALKAVPGGTIDRIETDSGDATYEAHMTKSDGTQVTVKFDKAGKVTAVEDGMGK